MNDITPEIFSLLQLQWWAPLKNHLLCPSGVSFVRQSFPPFPVPWILGSTVLFACFLFGAIFITVSQVSIKSQNICGAGAGGHRGTRACVWRVSLQVKVEFDSQRCASSWLGNSCASEEQYSGLESRDRLIGPPPVTDAPCDSTQEVTLVVKSPLFSPANGRAIDKKSLSTTTRPVPSAHTHQPWDPRQ
jgi:hypothetical protein